MTSEAALAEVLRPLLSQSGGVEDPEKFEKFRELLQKETALKGRFLLVTILELTKAEECLKQLVENEGLVTLNAWLLEARDAGVAKATTEGGGAEGGSSSIWMFASKIIEVLKKLPVTVDALTKAEVGKTVRSLTKLAQAGEVRLASKGLITQWKTRFVKQHDPASDGKKAAGKRPAVALKPVSDDSLFTSKPNKPPPPREARPYAPQRRKVQRLEDVPGSEKEEAPGPGSDQQPGAQGAEAAPKQPSSTPVGTGAASAAAATATAPTTTAVDRPKLIKISTTPRLGQFAHLTVIKPPTAAERAEAAAARVERELADLPAPPPRDPNKIRKAVSWAEDETLAAIRTFDKEQPPSSVCEDVEQQRPQDALLPSPSSELQHRLGFLSAAKREHSNECSNIGALHEGDGAEGPGGEGQSPKPWSAPPQILFRAEPQCASGESSVFYGEEVSRTQNVAEFTAVTSDPKSPFAHYNPFEPPALSEELKQAGADWVPPEVPWDVVQYAPPQQEQQQGSQYAAPQQQEQGYIAPPPPQASFGQPQQQQYQQQYQQQQLQQQHQQQQYHQQQQPQQYQQQQQPQQYHQQQHGYPPPPAAPQHHQYQQQYPPQQPPFSAPGPPPGPPAAPPPPPRPPSNGSQSNHSISNLVSQLDPSLVSKLLTRGL